MTAVAMPSTDLAPLTRAEAIALGDCEQRIERGLKTFIEVGQSLAAIRDNQLYRATHQTFEAYATERWHLSRAHAYRMIAAADVVSPMGDIETPPTSERQVRELAKVPEPARAEVWAEAVERTAGKPTAAVVRQVAEERAESPTKDQPAPPLVEGRSVGLPSALSGAGESDASVVASVAADKLPAAGPDPQAAVAAALDRFAPDPDAAARMWRGDLHAKLRPVHSLTLWIDPDDAAEFAADEDLETLRQLSLSFADIHRRILAARNANVVPLRSVR